MRRNFIMLLSIAALAFTGCSKIEEPVKIDEPQTEETTRATEGITGSTSLYQGNIYFFTCPQGNQASLGGFQNFVNVTWTFNKLDSAGKHVIITDGIIVNYTPRIYEYKITVNVEPGDYVIKASTRTSSGWGSPVFTIPVTVKSHKEDLVAFDAYKDKNGKLTYIQGRPGITTIVHDHTFMGKDYSFQAFKKRPVSEENVYYNNLIPVYKHLGTLNYQYSTAPASANSSFAFYILGRRMGNSVPLYYVVEVLASEIVSGKPYKIYGAGLLTTKNIASTKTMENCGVVGYAFPN